MPNTPVNRVALAVLALGVFVVVGTSAFFLSREVFSKDSPAKAQVPPDATPPIVEQPPHENLEKSRADSQKPKFVGQMNGIVFFDPASGPPQPFERCPPESSQNIQGAQAAASARSSPLDFTAGYVPQGYTLVNEEVLKCGEAILSVSRGYADAGGKPGSLSISHFVHPPQFVAEAPEDRLEEATVAGKPAVLVHPVFPGAPAKILMRGQPGNWIIAGNFSISELIKVAESVR